jgi:N-acetylmuramoyl-L-alanine amidase
MSDDPRHYPPNEPDPSDPASGPPDNEAVPEWLKRVRSKRAADERARQARSSNPQSIIPPPVEEFTDSDILFERTPPADAPLEPNAPPEQTPRSTPLPAPSITPPEPEEWADAIDAAATNPQEALPTPAPPSPNVEPVEQPVPQPPPVGAPPARVDEEPPDWVKALGEIKDETDAAAVETPSWLQAIIAEEAARPASPVSVAAPATEAAPLEARDEIDAEAEQAEQAEQARQARQRRVERRRERRARARQNSALTNTIQSLVVVGAAAALIATIFTFWTPANFLSDETREGLRPAYATLSAQSPPTPVPTPIWMRRIGIVSGHWGPHPSTGRSDPGAVCADGLTEAQVNRSVAQLVVQALSGRGYDVDLLDEWDPRLDGYQASVLLSIHADSCHHFEQPGATGFKVAPPAARVSARADDMRLHDCLVTQYGAITGMPLHPSLTRDMTEYHSFQEIDPVTPANIIELGFLYEDRDILENHPDVLAEGIVAGVLCFLENAPPTPLPELTPWPTLEATPTPLDTPGPS